MPLPFNFKQASDSVRGTRRRGFTLVELLVVIAIIGVLVGLLLPAVQMAREAARRMQCTNNLKQIGLALHNHHDAMKKFPPGYVFPDAYTSADMKAMESTWMVYILPYMEAQNLYDQLDFKLNFGSPGNDHVLGKPLPGFTCPSGPQELDPWFDYIGRGSYVGNNGIGPLTESTPAHKNNREFELEGVFSLNSKMRFSDMNDGSSNTVMVAEILMVPGADQRGCFYPEGSSYHHNRTPNNATPDEIRSSGCVSTPEAPCTGTFSSWNPRNLIMTARSDHSGGVNVLMGDGSVQFVSETIALNVWQSAGTPKSILDANGNREVPFPGF